MSARPANTSDLSKRWKNALGEQVDRLFKECYRAKLPPNTKLSPAEEEDFARHVTLKLPEVLKRIQDANPDLRLQSEEDRKALHAAIAYIYNDAPPTDVVNQINDLPLSKEDRGWYRAAFRAACAEYVDLAKDRIASIRNWPWRGIGIGIGGGVVALGFGLMLTVDWNAANTTDADPEQNSQHTATESFTGKVPETAADGWFARHPKFRGGDFPALFECLRDGAQNCSQTPQP